MFLLVGSIFAGFLGFVFWVIERGGTRAEVKLRQVRNGSRAVQQEDKEFVGQCLGSITGQHWHRLRFGYRLATGPLEYTGPVLSLDHVDVRGRRAWNAVAGVPSEDSMTAPRGTRLGISWRMLIALSSRKSRSTDFMVAPTSGLRSASAMEELASMTPETRSKSAARTRCIWLSAEDQAGDCTRARTERSRARRSIVLCSTAKNNKSRDQAGAHAWSARSSKLRAQQVSVRGTERLMPSTSADGNMTNRTQQSCQEARRRAAAPDARAQEQEMERERPSAAAALAASRTAF